MPENCGESPIIAEGGRLLAAGPREGLGWRAVIVIFLFGGTLLGIYLGRAHVLTFHEVIFAEPAREMIRTGDWGMTRFAGIPSTHKPPLTHWLVALSMLTFQSGAEWVCRLPSVVAAILTAWIVAALAARYHGRRVGLLCGLVQVSTFYTMTQARLAEADMPLCLLVTAAMALFALANVEPTVSPRLRPLVQAGFFAACGLALLTKSIIGPAFIFAGCGLYILIQRQWSSLRFFLGPIGWLVFLAITLPWPIWAYKVHPPILYDWFMHTFGRFGGRLSGGSHAWPLYYFYMVPAILLPWTVWAAPGVVAQVRQGLWRTPPWRFLFAWVAAGFAILTASAFKSKHYAIPLMPAFSIVAAWCVDREAFVRLNRFRLRPLYAGLLVGAACVAVPLIVQRTHPAMWLRAAIVTVTVGLPIWLALWFDYRKRPVATLVCLFAVFWTAGVAVQVLFMPALDTYRAYAELAREVNALAPPEVPVYLVDLPEDQITYYLRFPLTRIDDATVFEETVKGRTDSVFYIVTTGQAANWLSTIGSTTLLSPPVRRSKRDPFSPAFTARVFLKFIPAGPGVNPSVPPNESIKRPIPRPLY